jgi:ZIP family zinc transporter
MEYAVFGGLGLCLAASCLGAAGVFFFTNNVPKNAEKIFFGFAAGIMLAACVWSLLIPAMEELEARGKSSWLGAAAGVLAGAGFLYLLEIPLRKGAAMQRTSTLLWSAITLHNIPEGMAVGLAFALAAGKGGGGLAGAAALALGIGVQNIPEGAAVSLPLRQEGKSAVRAFAASCLSGAVEPAAGLAGFWAAEAIAPTMPWLLSFAAGAMLYVSVNELIPSAKGGKGGAGIISTMLGFLLMMSLDVALGGG